MYLGTNKQSNRSYKLYLQIQKNFADQILGLQRINNCGMSSDDKSCDGEKTTILSWQWLCLPKKAMTNRCIIPKRARRVIESNDQDVALFAKSERLLDGKRGNPLAIE